MTTTPSAEELQDAMLEYSHQIEEERQASLVDLVKLGTTKEELRVALDQAEENFRQAIVKSYRLNLPIQQISKASGVSRARVYQILKNSHVL